MENFFKSVEGFKKHPAYKDENLEIKNEKELRAAKKAAGVTTHEEVLKRREMAQMTEEERNVFVLFEDVFYRSKEDF